LAKRINRVPFFGGFIVADKVVIRSPKPISTKRINGIMGDELIGIAIITPIISTIDAFKLVGG